MHKTASLIGIITFLLLFTACDTNYTPLPRAYFRIDLPERDYTDFDTIFPYRFTYPTYARVVPDKRPNAESYWADLWFPDFGGALHLSYKAINHPHELNEFIEDNRTFVNRHIPKATGFQERIYTHEENRVFGILFQIHGKEAATPLQFYLTDSVSHFLRGSLYFHVSPNNDSLAPVIRYLTDDIMIMIESLQWK